MSSRLNGERMRVGRWIIKIVDRNNEEGRKDTSCPHIYIPTATCQVSFQRTPTPS
jgi:hypothetical protein